MTNYIYILSNNLYCKQHIRDIIFNYGTGDNN